MSDEELVLEEAPQKAQPVEVFENGEDAKTAGYIPINDAL